MNICQYVVLAADLIFQCGGVVISSHAFVKLTLHSMTFVTYLYICANACTRSEYNCETICRPGLTDSNTTTPQSLALITFVVDQKQRNPQVPIIICSIAFNYDQAYEI